MWSLQEPSVVVVAGVVVDVVVTAVSVAVMDMRLLQLHSGQRRCGPSLKHWRVLCGSCILLW
jgi:hypothetical protein